MSHIKAQSTFNKTTIFTFFISAILFTIATFPLATVHAGGGAGYQLDSTGWRHINVSRDIRSINTDIRNINTRIESLNQSQLDRLTEIQRIQRELERRFMVEDGLQWEASQRALEQTVSETINWINTGMNGDPLFIQNLNDYVAERVDIEVTNFIIDYEARLDSESPFTADIQLALQDIHTRNQRGDLPGYNAPSIQDPEAFIGGDFSQGGWGGFYQTVSSPDRNTPLGARFAAETEMERVRQNRMIEEFSKANWGDGFHSIERCDERGMNCQITTPGRVIADQLSKALGSSIDSLVAGGSMDQQVEASFMQLTQEATTNLEGTTGDTRSLLQIFVDLITEELGIGNINVDDGPEAAAQDVFNIIGNELGIGDIDINDPNEMDRLLLDNVANQLGIDPIDWNDPAQSAADLLRAAADDLDMTDEEFAELLAALEGEL